MGILAVVGVAKFEATRYVDDVISQNRASPNLGQSAKLTIISYVRFLVQNILAPQLLDVCFLFFLNPFETR